MPLLTGILSPEQLKMLTRVVEEHCTDRGIPADTSHYDEIAARVMSLFQTGRAATADQLALALAHPDEGPSSPLLNRADDDQLAQTNAGCSL